MAVSGATWREVCLARLRLIGGPAHAATATARAASTVATSADSSSSAVQPAAGTGAATGMAADDKGPFMVMHRDGSGYAARALPAMALPPQQAAARTLASLPQGGQQAAASGGSSHTDSATRIRLCLTPSVSASAAGQSSAGILLFRLCGAGPGLAPGPGQRCAVTDAATAAVSEVAIGLTRPGAAQALWPAGPCTSTEENHPQPHEGMHAGTGPGGACGDVPRGADAWGATQPQAMAAVPGEEGRRAMPHVWVSVVANCDRTESACEAASAPGGMAAHGGLAGSGPYGARPAAGALTGAAPAAAAMSMSMEQTVQLMAAAAPHVPLGMLARIARASMSEAAAHPGVTHGPHMHGPASSPAAASSGGSSGSGRPSQAGMQAGGGCRRDASASAAAAAAANDDGDGHVEHVRVACCGPLVAVARHLDEDNLLLLDAASGECVALEGGRSGSQSIQQETYSS